MVTMKKRRFMAISKFNMIEGENPSGFAKTLGKSPAPYENASL